MEHQNPHSTGEWDLTIRKFLAACVVGFLVGLYTLMLGLRCGDKFLEPVVFCNVLGGSG